MSGPVVADLLPEFLYRWNFPGHEAIGTARADLAPFLLKLMGGEAPPQMEGTVLSEDCFSSEDCAHSQGGAFPIFSKRKSMNRRTFAVSTLDWG